MKYQQNARACSARFLWLFFAFVSLGTVIVTAEKSSDLSTDDAFPDHCTWQCYLRQNQDLYETLEWKENVALDHWLNHGKKTGRNCACKVVFLAGPHKAASTTLQHLAAIYTRIENQLKPWAWPAGKDAKSFAAFPGCYYPNSGSYRVAYLENRTECTHIAIHHNPDTLAEFYGVDEKKVTDDMINFDTMKKIFKSLFQADYDEGNNLIFGTEGTDTLTFPDSIESDNDIASALPTKVKGYEDTTLLGEILDMLPQKVVDNKDEILNTFVVYRASRASQLRSTWGQMNSQNRNFRDYITFREFICKDRWIQTSFHWIDVMGVTLELLKNDFKVQLFDLSSVFVEDNGKSEVVNLMSVLYCDVMGTDCVYDTERRIKIPVDIALSSKRDKYLNKLIKPWNVAKPFTEEELAVTPEEMEKIDDLINEWDCVRYKEMEPYMDNLEIQHDTVFNEYMAKCKENPTITSRGKLISSMQEALEC